MRQQRAMFQTKDQDKNPRRQISEVETEDLPEKVFAVMIIKMNSGKKKNGGTDQAGTRNV